MKKYLSVRWFALFSKTLLLAFSSTVRCCYYKSTTPTTSSRRFTFHREEKQENYFFQIFEKREREKEKDEKKTPLLTNTSREVSSFNEQITDTTSNEKCWIQFDQRRVLDHAQTRDRRSGEKIFVQKNDAGFLVKANHASSETNTSV